MAVALATVLAAAACQQDAPTGVDAGAVPADRAGDVTPATGSATADASPARGTGADLNEAANRALGEGRLYAPAGDSAIEYWLAARDRDPDNPAITSAIVEMQPYLLIGCEQAIARHDFDEARRLHGLMGASDPAAPALQRLTLAIETAEAESGRAEAVRIAAEEAQRQRAEADARAAEMARAAATRVAAAQAVAEASPPVAPSAQGQAEPAPPPLQEPTPTQAVTARADEPAAASPTAQSAPPPAAAQAPPRSAAARPPSAAASAPAPRLLHQPPPRYPSLAMSRRMEGSVQVAFTIRPDGSVDGARVVGADPPGVFDRSALGAVSSYRFEPAGRTVASMVTVRFTLN